VSECGGGYDGGGDATGTASSRRGERMSRRCTAARRRVRAQGDRPFYSDGPHTAQYDDGYQVARMKQHECVSRSSGKRVSCRAEMEERCGKCRRGEAWHSTSGPEMKRKRLHTQRKLPLSLHHETR
jgi:hypothetical protein